MRFEPLGLGAVTRVHPDVHEDPRGSFLRLFCADEFERAGLATSFVQRNLSRNARSGTLRGLHFQAEPHGEAKLMRCVRGAAFCVVADIRSGSPTRGEWVGLELTAAEPVLLYVPEGMANGFQTLADNTEIGYQMSVPYAPESARGVRWDDPTLAIDWPETTERILSDRDRGLPFLEAGP